MKSIMRDLYYKRILPCELSPTHGAEYDELRCKMESEEQYFTSKLSVDDYRRFEDYKKLLWQLNSITDIDTFSQAFKLGTVLMMEMFFGEIEFPDS